MSVLEQSPPTQNFDKMVELPSPEAEQSTLWLSGRAQIADHETLPETLQETLITVYHRQVVTAQRTVDKLLIVGEAEGKLVEVNEWDVEYVRDVYHSAMENSADHKVYVLKREFISGGAVQTEFADVITWPDKWQVNTSGLQAVFEGEPAAAEFHLGAEVVRLFAATIVR